MKKRVNRFFTWAALLAVLSLLYSCKHDPPEPDCSQLTITTTIEDENCSDQDGSILIVSSGGDGAYTYSIDSGVTFQDSGRFVNLSAGTYNLVVRDGNQCEQTGVADVSTLASTVAFTVLVTDAGCSTLNGQLAISATGGDGNYSYSSDGFNFGPDSVITGLGTGDYTVVVKDGNGCTATQSIYIPAGDISYATDIAPIISASCGLSNCHDGSNSTRATLTDYSGLFSNRNGSMLRLKAGSMPKNPGSITASDKQKIYCWIDDGAPNN